MPRANPAKVSFAAGEVSPFLYGRTDLTKYQSGARTVLNMVVLPQGPVMKRPGSRFMAAAEDPAVRTRLIPFIFSRTDHMAMEFGEYTLRFLRDGAYVTVPSTTTILEIATPYTAAELTELCYAQQANLVVLTHPNHAPRKLLRTGTDTWSFAEMDLLDGPYLDANEDETVLLSVAITSDTNTLTALEDTFVVGDVGKLVEFLEDGKWRLARISAYTSARQVTVTLDEYDRVLTFEDNVLLTYKDDGDSEWMISSAPAFNAFMDGGLVRATVNKPYYFWVEFEVRKAGQPMSQVYGGEELPETILQYGRTRSLSLGTRVTLGTVTANVDTFVSTDVGRALRLRFENQWVWARIQGFTSTKQVSVKFYAPLPRMTRDITRFADDGVTSHFRLGAWSATTGWPAAVSFFEQRAVFGSTATQPQTFWMSVTDDYENHAPTDADSTVTDEAGITYTIATQDVNSILWFASGPTLLIGTAGAEFQARAASTVQEPTTPRNLAVTRQGTTGSLLPSRALFVNASTLFISNDGRSLHEMVYSFENDAFVTRDLTVFSEHILRTAAEIAYMQNPHRIIWARLTDGTLAGCTYLRDQEVVSWHRHQIASGSVESLCVLPSADGTDDELLLQINTGSSRHFELLSLRFEPDTTAVTEIDDVPFVDSYVIANGGSGTVISGLSRFEGQSVNVISEGIDLGAYTVSGGQVTVSENVNEVVVGLFYYAQLSSLALDTGSEFGTGLGKTGRIDTIGLFLINSSFFAYQSDSDWVEERLNDESAPDHSALFTGIANVPVDLTYTDEQRVSIRSQRPYPLCIAALLPGHKTND